MLVGFLNITLTTVVFLKGIFTPFLERLLIDMQEWMVSAVLLHYKCVLQKHVLTCYIAIIHKYL